MINSSSPTDFSKSTDENADVTRFSTHFTTPLEETPFQQTSEQKKPFAENLTIQYVIGEGGVGRVYFAYDEAIGRRVAVKELLNNAEQQHLSPQERQRLEKSFIHEAKITGKLEHPSIIPVYQLGYRPDAGAYYVMRYVKGGETLEEKLNRCKQSSIEQAATRRIKLLDALIDVCDALAYAHSKGVIHRDIKPSNIISGKFGETIVLDWGLAQVLRDSDDDFFSNAHDHQLQTYSDNEHTDGVGTLHYMAPEQLSGKASRASDVYSVGVILFQIITGHLPYKGNAQDIEAQLLSDAPSPSPNAYAGTISPELGAICEKAMAKNPDDRFSDASELVQQLKAYRDGRMINIYNYSKQELFRRFLAKNQLVMFMMLMVFIVIVAGSVFSVHYAMQMDQERISAEKALISVTALGDQAQGEAKNMATVVNTGIAELFADMTTAASQMDEPAKQQALLAALQAQYPSFASFTVENNNAIPANVGWKSKAQQFDAPIISKENGKLVLTFLVPLKKPAQSVSYLTAKVFPEKVIPSFFPTGISSSHPRDIWLMKEDGLIFYDKEEKYRGTNIFTDQINNQSASVVAFGQLAIDKPYGISYYSFPDNGKKISKIAAWETVAFANAKSWIIVVDYTYMVSRD